MKARERERLARVVDQVRAIAFAERDRVVRNRDRFGEKELDRRAQRVALLGGAADMIAKAIE